MSSRGKYGYYALYVSSNYHQATFGTTYGAYYIKVKFRCLQFHPFLTYKVLI